VAFPNQTLISASLPVLTTQTATSNLRLGTNRAFNEKPIPQYRDITIFLEATETRTDNPDRPSDGGENSREPTACPACRASEVCVLRSFCTSLRVAERAAPLPATSRCFRRSAPRRQKAADSLCWYQRVVNRVLPANVRSSFPRHDAGRLRTYTMAHFLHQSEYLTMAHWPVRPSMPLAAVAADDAPAHIRTIRAGLAAGSCLISPQFPRSCALLAHNGIPMPPTGGIFHSASGSTRTAQPSASRASPRAMAPPSEGRAPPAQIRRRRNTGAGNPVDCGTREGPQRPGRSP